MKTKLRHEKIMQLITSKEIETQDQLKNELNTHGFDVTQATVSRDIKKLKLYKAMNPAGRYCYIATQNKTTESGAGDDFFKSSVLGIDYALNNVVVKFTPGMAQAACAKIDEKHIDGVIGTVAGDDTALIITRSLEDSRYFADNFEKIFFN